MGRGRQGDVVYLPKMRTQIVAARTVAEALADLALSTEPEPEPEPEPEGATPVKIEAVSHPADPDDTLNENGGLLPGPHATLAGPTFAAWLEAES